MRMRHISDRVDVTNVACGIAYGLAKDRARRLVDQRGDIRCSIARRETRLDPVPFQRVGKQSMCRALELRRRYDAPAAIGGRQKGVGEGDLS
jgi:hypothetical protein